jgi:alcohol dehydrogenase
MVYTRPLTLELLDVADPEPADDHVLIQVRAAGICGSELDGFRSQSPLRVPPLIMGHEFAGELPDGRLVAVNPILSCHRCAACVAGQPNICASVRLIGVHRDGAFAEYVSVPASNCHPLAPGMTAVQGSLVEPFANAVHAYNLATMQGHSPMLAIGVIGAGAIGLSIATLALQSATARVVVADLDPVRLRAAECLGVDEVATELTGTFDVIFDAVGTAGTRLASVKLIRPGGTAVWVGLHSPDAALAGQSFVREEKRVLGSFAYTPMEFAAAANLVARAEPQWTTARPLTEGPETFTALLDSSDAAARTVLTCP